MEACEIRALWILSNRTGDTCFSRRFPVVEQHWRVLQDAHRKSLPDRKEVEDRNADVEASQKPESNANAQDSNSERTSSEQVRSAESIAESHLGRSPFDSEVASSCRAHQEVMETTHGLRKLGTKPGSDAWLDDPITQSVIGLSTSAGLLWPVVKHLHGAFTILVLPLVDPLLVEDYEALQSQRDDTNPGSPRIGDLSTLILLTPAITMALSVASALGQVITPPAELPNPTAPSAASLYSFGLMDSLTGFAKSSAQKAVSAQAAKAEPSTVASGVLRKEDKDALRTFIAGAIPLGQPLDLNPCLAAAIASNGFGAADIPPSDQKQPFWKPYLYRGKQRLTLFLRERVSGALFDRPEVEDRVTISGEVVCRADLEGLPDITVALSLPKSASSHALSVHPCAQAPESTQDGATLYLSPPLGLFTLARYQLVGRCETAPVRGFFQCQMLSETKAAVLVRLTLMEGLKKCCLEHCTLVIPFAGRTIVSLEGAPSIGSLTHNEGSLEWRVITPGRWFGGKTGEANLSATVLLAARDKEPGGKLSETEENATASFSGRPATWADPFAWDEYSHARVSFRLSGGTLSEASIDPAKVVLYPPAKASVEVSYEVVEGDYILWNSLGKSPPVQ